MSLYESTTVNLTITVLDTATIFEGPESIYRYDLPGTAIVEGWALSGVMEQAQKLLPAQWPDVRVAVVADSSGGPMSHEAVKIIRRQLQVHDVIIAEREPVTALAIPQHEPEELEPEEIIDDDEIIRPVGDEESFLERIKQRKGLIAIIVVVVLIIILIAWFFLRSATSAASDSAAPVNTTSIAEVGPAPEISTQASETSGTQANTSAAPAHQTIEAGGLRVMLPAGFTHTEEEGLVTATGQDPNLRIIMAMDPLYAVPANALFAEVRAQIDSDETLSNPHEANGRLTYLEHPGDDSEVTWTTWVEDDQQVSLGCHTRKAPSMAQRAACRMASESIEKVS
ncbi:MAG: type VII secretion-associated protein [Corynebacterium casei]|uniref:type VII secretion-associated protein n=1 Tax=Corynebacterium casei TaxID=160386 RepID=UPI0026472D45|nr:type VII secretion-associated protein [Corynebacterium casei]MDN5840178.1 type VII secretion-associated protein [Corynebacterium casei]